MPQILAVLLVCAASVEPGDCTRDTARDVQIIGAVPTPFPCMMGGMVTLAREAERVSDAAYGKITCERRKGQDHAAR